MSVFWYMPQPVSDLGGDKETKANALYECDKKQLSKFTDAC